MLYAPGLRTKADIAAVVSSVDRPVNVLMGLPGVQLSRDDLSAIGVKRISVGSALSRVALAAFLSAAREILGTGTFAFGEGIVSTKELGSIFAP